MLWPNPETFAMATAQLNTNYVTEVKTKPEFAGNRGWLDSRDARVGRGLFSGHDLSHQPGRLRASKDTAANMMLLYQNKQAAPMSERQKWFDVSWSSRMWRFSDFGALSWWNPKNVSSALPSMFSFLLGRGRSHFVPNHWRTSAHEVASSLTGPNTAEGLGQCYEALKQGYEEKNGLLSTFQNLSSFSSYSALV